MRAVVAIVQCRRAVLPHIFLKYVLPRMRAMFPGELDAVLVQHRALVRSRQAELESLEGGAETLEVVRAWTEAGRYDGAQVIAHEVAHPPYPSIPSYHFAVRAAVERGADFLLVMEDDALVFDWDCSRWDALLGPSEVGVYRRFHHINSAYFVARRSYQQRIVEPLADYRRWTWRRRLEPFLRSQLRTSRAYLNPAHAVRYHRCEYPNTGLRYVVDAVRELAPDAVDLLDTDFGPRCSLLPPITADDRARHARADGAKLHDRLWRARTNWVEWGYKRWGR